MVIRRPDGSYMTGGLAHRKEYKYGKFEFRINAGKDPLNATSAIALTWPDSENWPQDGENDIYETLFKRNSFETFIHYAVDGQDQKHQKTHLIDPTQWHIVAMEWMPEYIKIYCDNNLEWTLKDTKAIPDVFHHICFQIEVDETKEITDTIAMQVDWVKCISRFLPENDLIFVTFSFPQEHFFQKIQNSYRIYPHICIVMKILIVEDEKKLSHNIAAYLTQENYVCETADNFRTALDKIGGFDYDCVLLDITLPDGNGLSVLEQLKKEKRTDGVIIISAKDSIDDKIAGLNLGADDYIAKPFHMSELSARVAAVIRRRKFDGSSNLVVNELLIDTTAKTAHIHGRLLDITKMQYDLLLYFVVNKNRVISKAAIAEHLSGDNAEYFDNYDVVYAHVKNLKKKIAEADGNDYIKTIYGMGYKFEAE